MKLLHTRWTLLVATYGLLAGTLMLLRPRTVRPNALHQVPVYVTGPEAEQFDLDESTRLYDTYMYNMLRKKTYRNQTLALGTAAATTASLLLTPIPALPLLIAVGIITLVGLPAAVNWGQYKASTKVRTPLVESAKAALAATQERIEKGVVERLVAEAAPVDYPLWYFSDHDSNHDVAAFLQKKEELVMAGLMLANPAEVLRLTKSWNELEQQMSDIDIANSALCEKLAGKEGRDYQRFVKLCNPDTQAGLTEPERELRRARSIQLKGRAADAVKELS